MIKLDKYFKKIPSFEIVPQTNNSYESNHSNLMNLISNLMNQIILIHHMTSI